MPRICDGILVRMSRTFKTVDYDQALALTLRLGDCLPSDHLARFLFFGTFQFLSPQCISSEGLPPLPEGDRKEYNATSGSSVVGLPPLPEGDRKGHYPSTSHNVVSNPVNKGDWVPAGTTTSRARMARVMPTNIIRRSRSAASCCSSSSSPSGTIA